LKLLSAANDVERSLGTRCLLTDVCGDDAAQIASIGRLPPRNDATQPLNRLKRSA